MPVPDREGEHAAQAVDAPSSVRSNTREHGLGVAVRVVPHARRLEVGAQRGWL